MLTCSPYNYNTILIEGTQVEQGNEALGENKAETNSNTMQAL